MWGCCIRPLLKGLQQEISNFSDRRNMSYSWNNLARIIALVTLGSGIIACGESDVGEPFSADLTYCDNPAAAEPSCSLDGYSVADDSALRAKLEGCATGGCHGASGLAATTWTLDLSGSVQAGLSALTTFADDSPYFLVDDSDPDCSQMLSEVTSKPVGAVRMPVTGGFWSAAEADCFRSYLHEVYSQ